jgi:hypothetical protein
MRHVGDDEEKMELETCPGKMPRHMTSASISYSSNRKQKYLACCATWNGHFITACGRMHFLLISGMPSSSLSRPR